MKLSTTFSPLTLSDESVFELFDNQKGRKTINLNITWSVKYAVLVHGSELVFDIETQQDWGELDFVVLCPMLTSTPTDLTISLNFRHSHCSIQLHVISLIWTSAKNRVCASINMDKGIEKTKSALLEETVILSDTISVENQPILDIHSNDIQAAHGAKIYRLDSDKIFYLQSRGFSSKEAQALLIASYGSIFFENIPIDEEYKKQLISKFLIYDKTQNA